jgi:hypothetical protein
LKAAKQLFEENSLVTTPHPPYGPNLVPSDFWLFGHTKESIARRVLNDVNELLEVVIEFVNKIQLSKLRRAFHHWIERVKSAFAKKGNPYHEETTHPKFAG